MSLLEILEENGLSKLYPRLYQNRFDLDILREVVRANDAYMKELIKGTCDINDSDMETLNKALILFDEVSY
jgi:hypothetical protein